MGATMKPGDWIVSLHGYEDLDEPSALVIATSRHKHKLNDVEIATEIERANRRLVREVTWWGSTKEHRANSGCECEEGSFCEASDSKSAVTVALCVPAGLTANETSS